MEIEMNCVHRALTRFSRMTGSLNEGTKQQIHDSCLNNLDRGVYGSMVLQEILGSENIMFICYESFKPEDKMSKRKGAKSMSNLVKLNLSYGAHVFVNQPEFAGELGHIEHFAPCDRTNKRKMKILHVLTHNIAHMGSGAVASVLGEEDINKIISCMEQKTESDKLIRPGL